MVNKKNVAFITVLFLGVFFWAIGIETTNTDCLNFSYSIFSGWIVGVLCNIHERERKIEITEQLNRLLKSREEKREVIRNLNEIVSICQTVHGIITNYFSINGVEQKKNEFSKHSLELSKINTSKIGSKYLNEMEKEIIESLKNKILVMLSEFDSLQNYGYEEVPNSTYASPSGLFHFSIGLLQDSQRVNQLVSERNEEIDSLEQSMEELRRKE